MAKETKLAQWLREQLNRLDITQNELARQAGVSSATISAIRHGHTPTADTMRTLAKFFNVDTESLLEIAGIIEPLSDIPSDIPEDTRALLRRLRRLPDADREEVMRLMDSFISFVESRPRADQPGGNHAPTQEPEQGDQES